VEDCIAQYLAPELLSDVTCEMCSLQQTHQHYVQDSERLAAPASSVKANNTTSHETTKSGSFSALEHVKPNTNGIETPTTMTSSRKKRAKETKRVENRLKEMLDSGTITHFGESFIPPSAALTGGPLSVKWQTVRTDSIREAAITRAPQSLRLHFIRSEYTPYGQLLKKNARVNFPLVLDLTRFVANGVWEERNVMGMLSGPPDQSASASTSIQPKIMYRLESVILHYGYNHSSGHYICIRRKPQPTQDEEGSHRPTTSRKSCADGCRCDDCCWFGQVRDPPENKERGKGWLRISDADVDEVGIEALVEARSAVFMVFYEKVGEFEGGKGKGKKGEAETDNA
jgi:ubiquitin carboxyl-terminal hydrolase 1